MIDNENKDSIQEEISLFVEEAERLGEDETYHSWNLSESELRTKTNERNYYIELKNEYTGVTDVIYVDRHDYLLYKRPIWREWKRRQLEKRCLIPAKNSIGYKHCMEDCENCPYSRSGKPVSLDVMKEDANYEHPDDAALTPDQLAFFKEAVELLWGLIEKVSTKEQFEKIKLRYKEELTYREIGEIYGVSHKAIEKSIKGVLDKLQDVMTESERRFLYKYILRN